MDPLVKPLGDESYQHWGTFTYPDGSTEQEPNNFPPRAPELCSVGNYTQAYGNETALTFGWADQNCSASHIVICKVSEPGVSPWYTTNSTNITYYLNTSLVRGLQLEAVPSWQLPVRLNTHAACWQDAQG